MDRPAGLHWRARNADDVDMLDVLAIFSAHRGQRGILSALVMLAIGGLIVSGALAPTWRHDAGAVVSVRRDLMPAPVGGFMPSPNPTLAGERVLEVQVSRAERVLVADTPWRHAVGDRVRVAIDPGSPSQAQLVGLVPSVLVGILMLGVGICLLMRGSPIRNR